MLLFGTIMHLLKLMREESNSRNNLTVLAVYLYT